MKNKLFKLMLILGVLLIIGNLIIYMNSFIDKQINSNEEIINEKN